MNAKIFDILTQIVIILTIISLLAGLFNSFFSYTDKPHLTYESGYYPLSEGKSLGLIILRNEGQKIAEDVEININAKGEIENVMGQKGFILEQIEDEVLFYDNPEYELKKDNLSSKIKIHQIPKGVKYTVSVIVKKGSGDPIDELMVESGNGGTEEKYPQNENSFLKIFAVTIVAFIAGALWAIKIY